MWDTGWLVDNKLSLHLGKTESILFGSKKKLNNLTNNAFMVTCCGHQLETQHEVKYLGVLLDELLSGELIANSVIQKVNQLLKFMYRNSDCLSHKTTKTLCSALIQCHFDYACSSWFEGKRHKQKLQITQNKVVRFISKLDSRKRITYAELEHVNMLNVKFRVKQLKLNHVFNIVHNICPSYLKDSFIIKDVGYDTRSSQMNFKIKSTKGQESLTFFHSVARDWNNLPCDIKQIKNEFSFKRQVKKHYHKVSKDESENEYVYF